MRAYGIEVRFESDPGQTPSSHGPASPGPLSEEGVPPRLPHVAVDFLRRPGAAPSETSVELTSHRALLRSGGRLTVDVNRHTGVSVCTAPVPVTVDEVIHPLLAFVGAAHARWEARSALHAATVVIAGRAWVLLGSATGGKSSLAAALHARGFVVLTDDLTVIEENTAFAGVRVADLREAPHRLGLTAREVNRAGQPRWRIDLGSAPSEVEVGGFVQLEWGDSVSAHPLGAAARLAALTSNDALLAGPTRPTSFLDLLPFPFFALRRPRAWSDLDSSIDLLVACAS